VLIRDSFDVPNKLKDLVKNKLEVSYSSANILFNNINRHSNYHLYERMEITFRRKVRW